MSELESLIKLQNEIGRQIIRLEDNFSKAPGTRITKQYIDARKEALDKLLITYNQQHMDITREAAEEDEKKYKYFIEKHFDAVSDLALELYSKIATKLDTLSSEERRQALQQHQSTNNQPVNTAENMDVRLARISIPPFNGDYTKWSEFDGMFKSLVHQKNIPNIQKLHYLKTHLGGDAARLIRNIEITEDNYNIAYQTLKNRYQNERLLINAQLKRLFTQTTMSSESSHGIRQLLDTTTECLTALINLKIDTKSWDPFIVYFIIQRLDSESVRLWEQNIADPRKYPTFAALTQFMENRFQSLQMMLELKPRTQYRESNKSSAPVIQKHQNTHNSRPIRNFHLTSLPQCKYCDESHSIFKCNQFIQLDTQQRYNWARESNRCFNCLESGHSTARCSSKFTCSNCKKNHHTLLHPADSVNKTYCNLGTVDAEENTPEIQDDNDTPIECTYGPSPSTSVSALIAQQTQQVGHVLLATALIKVIDYTGTIHTVRALIDQGSQASFITEEIAQLLKVKRNSTNTKISGIGVLGGGTVQGMAQIRIESFANPGFQLVIDALILPKLTKHVPNQRITVQTWEHVIGLSLADPLYFEARKIDMLLGADIYADIILSGMVKGDVGTPIAQQTQFGWILSGPTNQQTKSMLNVFHTTIEVNEQLKKFWEMEEILPTRNFTIEERKCEQGFTETVSRDIDGRYIVKLPFKTAVTDVTFGKSRDRAVARQLQLEKKFAKNKTFHQEYVKFMDDYIKLGHMVEVSSKCPELSYYIPHHAVLKESSSTTKLRVVFDATAKTSTGTSLNDQLLVGPTLQSELFNIILRWRTYKICFTADIQQMYRQILSAKNDWDLQRIVWRSSPTHQISDFQLRTVTYGTAAAPYLAVKTLQQLAQDYEAQFPSAYKAVHTNFYVDDVMAGGDNEDEVKHLQDELINLLNLGGFHLRKWASNSEKILNNISQQNREINVPLEVCIHDTVKTLGIHWNPSLDVFQFKVKKECCSPITMRNVLSNTAKLFDPLGWLAPTVVIAKQLFQQLWLYKLKWDDTLPEQLSSQWLKFEGELQRLENIKLPRWTGYSRNHSIELHGFCDASEKSYAAVLYVRSTNNMGNTQVILLTAKTKVAPIKTISLPRLELCGAILLAKLIKKVKNTMEIENKNIHAWCDSMVVLAWLRGHPSRWKTFVANRVTEIIDIIPSDRWHHVASAENPADCASRGVMPNQLTSLWLWWNGPHWLIGNWEKVNKTQIKSTNLEEKNNHKMVLVVTSDDTMEMMGKFGKLQRLIRVTAYCKRFITNASKQSKFIGVLSPHELNKATETWIKIIQNIHYAREIALLASKKPVHPKSNILSLNPFIDSSGVLRVGGRLQNAALPFERKFPIILPSATDFTKLLIIQAHERTLHGGTQLTTTYIRNKYWIVRSRNMIRKQLFQCVRCHRFRAQFQGQLMGNLPASRVTMARPFSNCGVDYAGPINTKPSKGRGVRTTKGYIAIFVCLSTRAIHIEVVTDVSAETFIAAFRRFVARRGRCTTIYSDNGTNFVGANRLLIKEGGRYAEKFNKTVAEVLANEGTHWHFIPPASPNFGGLWEAGVKSIKHHLKRVVGDTTLTYEELTTVTAEIEACLNSRPLCALTEDPDDLSALTPGHFLIGQALVGPPQTDFLSTNINCIKKWQITIKMKQHFWNRWSKEHLNRLQQRAKWTNIQREPCEGDLMILKDENLPPTKWSLCRITKLHRGIDKLSRVATIKTANGTYTRPLVKLSPLPIVDNQIQYP